MKRITTVLATMAILPTAFAATTAAKTTKTEATNESAKTIKAYERVVVDESMMNRMNKKYTINGTMFGASFGAGTSAIEAGYFIKPNMIASIQYTSLNSTSIDDGNNDEEDKVWERDGVGHAISAGIKKFESNSFYYKPEIYARSQELVNSTTSAYTSSTGWVLTGKDTSKIEDIGISFKIGNQWQWENFTLGCDWIGITRSLNVTKKEGTIESQDRNSASVLNFYMGASF